MRIAAFKMPGRDWVTYYDEPMGASMVQHSGYVRISEFVDVTFPPLPVDVVVESQLTALASAEQELRNQFQTKLDQIQSERAKLLALTHESQS